MAWVRLDDTVPHHPKHLKAGPEASWLWVCAIAYCQRQLTDGFVPVEALSMLSSCQRPDKLASHLVTVGLFDVIDGGYRVHDYHDYNATAAEARERAAQVSQARRRAGRVGGQRSAQGKHTASKSQANEEANGQANVKQTYDDLLQAHPSNAQAPSHPIPVIPQPPLGAVVPHMSDRIITDPELADKGALVFELWPAVYSNARKGALPKQAESRDWPTVLKLVHSYPDVDRLMLMADVFLRRTDIGQKNVPGTLGQFAHMAPDCDRLLREHGR